MTDPRLVPDRERAGAWWVRIDGIDHSYVNPDDPMYLEFDYMQRIAEIVDQLAPPGERITAIHVGGAGMTLPRYIAATRPSSAQTVLEPDVSLTRAVRDVVPLPRRSGIKVRAVDGRAGIAAFRDGAADIVIVDAFAGSQVPAELSTREWFASVVRVLRPDGVVAMNVTDRAPLTYTRRLLATLSLAREPALCVVEPSTLKGRRFGNIIAAAGPRLDVALLARQAARAAFPYRVLAGEDLRRWVGPARPLTDADPSPSPPPPDGPAVYR